jgi:hypothetical protein
VKRNIDERLELLAEKIKKRNLENAQKDIGSFRVSANNFRKVNEPQDMGKDLRLIAKIPSSVFYLLPKEVQEDPKAVFMWLKKEGKDFLIVNKL